MIHLDRNIPFIHATLSGSIVEAVNILRAAERRHSLRWTMDRDASPESDSNEWLNQHLWPFFSETHFVLSGGDLQLLGCSLRDKDGVDHTPSWRHWGHSLADWANQHWFARPTGLGQTDWSRAKRPWHYLDFYSHDHLSYLIADYDEWLEALRSVLQQRNAAL